MADDTKPKEGFADPAANTQDVKQKLEAQGPETGGAKPADLKSSGDALDELAKNLVEKKDKEKVEDAPADPAPHVVPAVVPDPKEEEAKVKAEAERAEALKKSEALFRELPGLPPGASPKSSEAFAAVKIRAAQEISARERELEETRAKLKEAEDKLAAGPDPEVAQELQDHRTWRAKLDVDADPKFKEFDKQVASSQEFIYAQLRRSPAVSTETIDKIKKLGGPENVDLVKIFEAVKDPTMQRIVESKIADIEMAKFNKEQAIKTAKENITGYVAERQKSIEAGATAHNTATQKEFSNLTGKLTWYAERPVDQKADEPTRKAAAEHNKFVAETRTQLEAAFQDDTPQMRALLLVGMAQLLYLQRVRAGDKVQIDTLTKDLADRDAKIAKFANAAGAGRLRESAAPQGGAPAAPKSKDIDVTTTSTEALDNLAKQVMEERARKLA